jgi:hypothetical protein
MVRHREPCAQGEAGDASVKTGESAEHRELKRLALIWAQARGFRIAAAEVALPNYRYRLDVAACRMERSRGRLAVPEGAGRITTAIFECKASRQDFRRDACVLTATAARLKTLHERKARVEDELRLYYPSIRNGDSLFPEYETLNFERPGYERYVKLLGEIARLSTRLEANTKFDRLGQWGVANLRYIVAEAAALERHEVPSGWGLLVRENDSLQLIIKPVWRDLCEEQQFVLLQRVALAATRAVNAAYSVTYEHVASAAGAEVRSAARSQLSG